MPAYKLQKNLPCYWAWTRRYETVSTSISLKE